MKFALSASLNMRDFITVVLFAYIGCLNAKSGL